VVEIVPIADADIEETGAAMARAFWSDPLLGKAFPDEVERTERAAPLFADGLRYSQLVGLAFVPAGLAVGAACGWKLPKSDFSADQYLAAGVRSSDELLGTEANQRFTAITDAIDEHLFRLVPPPCWYIGVLGVDPAHQKQGLGAALVRSFIDLAGADGLPLCLWTANPTNLRFYKGLGFEVVGEGNEPSSDLPYWLFCR
jgi:ribosomal protein S18 acetylase RimI-like enzyme